jgi:hypothetical protein
MEQEGNSDFSAEAVTADAFAPGIGGNSATPVVLTLGVTLLEGAPGATSVFAPAAFAVNSLIISLFCNANGP